MHGSFREGPLGALMDEYERAAMDLWELAGPLGPESCSALRAPEAEDPDCRSIQTVFSHVIRSGFRYADYLRAAFQLTPESPRITQVAHGERQLRLMQMLAYTADTLDGRWTLDSAALARVAIHSAHGPVYDAEQLLEHAIVHVLRHRRQIERFLWTRA